MSVPGRFRPTAILMLIGTAVVIGFLLYSYWNRDGRVADSAGGDLLDVRTDTTADEAELEEVYTTERHLLYVACTRARDHLLVTGVDPASEFLDDLRT